MEQAANSGSAQHTPGPFLRGHRSAPDTPGRRAFLRRELARFEAQAAFNRAHYSEAEAACWVALAEDARAAIAKATGDQS